MKKKLLIISGCAFVLHVILSVIAIGIYFRYSIDSEEIAGQLSKYFKEDRLESVFLSEEPDVLKVINVVVANDGVESKNDEELKEMGCEIANCTLYFDDEGNVIKEGGILAAYKYIVENGETVRNDDLAKTDIYGDVPIEYVFTKEQFDHIRELAANNENVDVKMDSYYRKGNWFYPLSVTVIDNGNIVETIECQKDYDAGDAKLVENDDMMIDFMPKGMSAIGEYKNETCLKLREEAKKFVTKNGFEEGTNHYCKYGFGTATVIITSKNPDMNIIRIEKTMMQQALIKPLVIWNSFVLSVLVVVDLVIILVLRKKKTKVKAE